MKAIVITRPGDRGSLRVAEVDRPEPRGPEIRVRVHASGLNRADLLQAKGHYPPPPGSPADIPGLEYAGEVDALGPDAVGPLKVGDRVFGIVGGGGFAEYLTCHERTAVSIPANLDFEAAAAVPEAFLTAHDAIATQARVRAGQRVLVQAVGGGVGSAAVQVAHAMGCQVFGTSRTAAKLDLARSLGLDVAIDASREDFAAVVRDRTGGEGVHAVIDFLGAPALGGNLAALAIGGRLVLVGVLGGQAAEVDLRTLMQKRLTVVGTTLRSRPIEEKIAATLRFGESVVPWLARGLVRPVVDRVYAFEAIGEAVGRMSSNLGFGKVVLRLGAGG